VTKEFIMLPLFVGRAYDKQQGMSMNNVSIFS
jgi:hypothetical protein